MRRLAVCLVLAALAACGCLGVLERDRGAEAIAFAPREPLDLPARESRPYWLLRTEAGWAGAHEVRFGGNLSDPAVAVVRAVRFRDEDAAARAFARLTPAYLYLVFRDRMTWEPRLFDYPEPLPGDAVTVWEYGVRLPSEQHDAELIGQMTAVRAGRVVLLVESIGVTPDHLVPAVEQLVQAAGRVSSRFNVQGSKLSDAPSRDREPQL